jgi:hypothetical protein
MAKNLGHIESLARSYTDTAIKTLAGIMMEPSAPARARIAAAAILLDRGWGKPKENVELPDAEPRQITHIVREIVHLPPGGVQLDMEPATRRGAKGDAGQSAAIIPIRSTLQRAPHARRRGGLSARLQVGP